MSTGLEQLLLWRTRTFVALPLEDGKWHIVCGYTYGRPTLGVLENDEALCAFLRANALEAVQNLEPTMRAAKAPPASLDEIDFSL